MDVLGTSSLANQPASSLDEGGILVNNLGIYRHTSEHTMLLQSFIRLIETMHYLDAMDLYVCSTDIPNEDFMRAWYSVKSDPFPWTCNINLGVRRG